MDNKDAYIEHLENTIVNLNETISGLQNQISNLTEMIMLLRKEKFGSSSEKTPKQLDGQISLFNEAEIEADESVPEPVKKTVHGYLRNANKTKREELIKDLPVREILCETPSDSLYCPNCLSDLKPIGKEVVREELEYIPAKIQIVRYVPKVCECSSFIPSGKGMGKHGLIFIPCHYGKLDYPLFTGLSNACRRTSTERTSIQRHHSLR